MSATAEQTSPADLSIRLLLMNNNSSHIHCEAFHKLTNCCDCYTTMKHINESGCIPFFSGCAKIACEHNGALQSQTFPSGVCEDQQLVNTGIIFVRWPDTQL